MNAPLPQVSLGQCSLGKEGGTNQDFHGARVPEGYLRASKGLAVVYTTSEVGECLSIAHRIVVMSKGRISAIFDASVSKERIMAASGESLVA